MQVGKETGLWSLKIEIGQFAESKPEDLYITFRGCTKQEWIALQNYELNLIVEPEKSKTIRAEDDKGKERLLNADSPKKRLEYLDKLLQGFILEHNFEKSTNEKMTNKEVWDWVSDRPDLWEFILTEWREQHPFHKAKEKK